MKPQSRTKLEALVQGALASVTAGVMVLFAVMGVGVGLRVEAGDGLTIVGPNGSGDRAVSLPAPTVEGQTNGPDTSSPQESSTAPEDEAPAATSPAAPEEPVSPAPERETDGGIPGGFGGLPIDGGIDGRPTGKPAPRDQGPIGSTRPIGNDRDGSEDRDMRGRAVRSDRSDRPGSVPSSDPGNRRGQEGRRGGSHNNRDRHKGPRDKGTDKSPEDSTTGSHAPSKDESKSKPSKSKAPKPKEPRSKSKKNNDKAKQPEKAKPKPPPSSDDDPDPDDDAGSTSKAPPPPPDSGGNGGKAPPPPPPPPPPPGDSSTGSTGSAPPPPPPVERG